MINQSQTLLHDKFASIMPEEVAANMGKTAGFLIPESQVLNLKTQNFPLDLERIKTNIEKMTSQVK